MLVTFAVSVRPSISLKPEQKANRRSMFVTFEVSTLVRSIFSSLGRLLNKPEAEPLIVNLPLKLMLWISLELISLIALIDVGSAPSGAAIVPSGMVSSCVF